MTIESTLERIAVSLETLVKAATPQQAANEAPASTPTKGRKKVAAEKAPEPTPEPDPSEGNLDADPPAEPASGGFDDEPTGDSVVEDVPSKEDMIAALTELGSVVGTDKARELMAKFGGGAKKASEVAESKRAEVIKQAKDAKAKAEKAKK